MSNSFTLRDQEYLITRATQAKVMWLLGRAAPGTDAELAAVVDLIHRSLDEASAARWATLVLSPDPKLRIQPEELSVALGAVLAVLNTEETS